VEHAVLHLLYARFWHKFLYDLRVVSTPEPFYKLVNQGIILGEDGEKMSKSRGNVINPDSIIKQYGADSLRMYEMFLGPLFFSKPWNSQGIIGIYRFLNRVWDLIVNSDLLLRAKRSNLQKDGLIMTKEAKKKLKTDSEELERYRHQVIKKVTEDIENFHFNTAISSLMSYVNELSEIPPEYLDKKYLETLVILLSPFAPHLSEELWRSFLHHRQLVSANKWPGYNKRLIEEKNLILIIQVNGKTRGTIKIKKGISQNQTQKLATPIIKKYLDKHKIKKIIFVENKLINFVLKS